MSNTSIHVSLPEEWAAEAVKNGVGRRIVPRRGTVDTALLLLGATGSVISLLQTPKTLEDFGAWISKCLKRRASDEKVVLNMVVRGKDAERMFRVEFAEYLDADAVIALLNNEMSRKSEPGA